MAAVLWFAFGGKNDGVGTNPSPSSKTAYPIGRTDKSQASGKAPPGANAMANYTLSYVSNFGGTALPPSWYDFTGIPGGDPGGQFASSHVVVKNSELILNTFKDRAFHKKWVTGGLCQCGYAQTYGAYFVRSRQTGSGPNDAELLWPKAAVWPPEIDFNENGGRSNGTSSTVHFGSTNHIDQRFVRIDMTKWHTWGVIWGPSSIIYTVDGHQWASITAKTEIPHQPMTLDIEQRVRCATGSQCPSQPVSMIIDWVAEYKPRISK